MGPSGPWWRWRWRDTPPLSPSRSGRDPTVQANTGNVEFYFRREQGKILIILVIIISFFWNIPRFVLIKKTEYFTLLCWSFSMSLSIMLISFKMFHLTTSDVFHFCFWQLLWQNKSDFLSRFFELYTCRAEKEAIVLVTNGSQMIKKINITEVWGYSSNKKENLSIKLCQVCPTEMRQRMNYCRDYVLIANFFVMMLLPFTLISIMNTRMYKTIIQTSRRNFR